MSSSLSEEEQEAEYLRRLRTVLDADLPRLKGATYLDYAGSGLYTNSQLSAVCDELSHVQFGNPHSVNPVGTRTGHLVNDIRNQVLESVGASLEHYDVIFTAGCTGGLKLIAETFPFSPGSVYAHLQANHNSVLGIRCCAMEKGASVRAVPVNNMPQFSTLPAATTPYVYAEEGALPKAAHRPGRKPHRGMVAASLRLLQASWSMWRGTAVTLCRWLLGRPLHSLRRITASYSSSSIGGHTPAMADASSSCHLFAMPAVCNFSGDTFDLDWIQQVRARTDGRWFVLLDAAALYGKGSLCVDKYQPDFVVFSFYKAFGYPTGLGALLVRRAAAEELNKVYFGGSHFEDGTVNFLSICAIPHGLAALAKLGGPAAIAAHVSWLEVCLVNELLALRHTNGKEVVTFYGARFKGAQARGSWPKLNDAVKAKAKGVVTFNLKDEHGRWIGFSQVETLAGLNQIMIRTGAFCNPGACSAYLGLSIDEMLHNLKAGHVCSDARDIMHGKPTGAVRVSVGPYTTKDDVDVFVNFVRKYFVAATPSTPMVGVHTENGASHKLRLSALMVYPVKSCAGLALKEALVTPRGLQHDREWAIIDPRTGHAIVQKMHPRMALLRPRISEHNDTLVLTAPDMPPLSLHCALPTHKPENSEMAVRVYGSARTAACFLDSALAHRAQEWLTKFLGTPATLMRVANDAELSFSNEAHLLATSEVSVEDLQERIAAKYPADTTVEVGIGRFRPNIVVSGGHPWQEDTWETLQIGDVVFDAVGWCGRCMQVNKDEAGADSSSREPLLTLSSFRRQVSTGRILFGTFLTSNKGKNDLCSCADPVVDSPERQGVGLTLRIGDEVKVLSSKAPPLLQ
eukprot:NODE_289_length_2743_cov_67.652672_g273_i0.p1 GENE.NODE_289_length_2743_cov_67.652672_g273_i0~~NODE_289_length_2743_cov_67.652672_g273_i0.p1  ORF type:complete len:854 (-),score=131.14 NODE_289_length_2743_cov_67.652672_g273_i0:108-2669(-)